MDAAYLFAKNFVNTKYEDLPADVVDATKKEILDLLGVALGGANQPGATHVCALVKEWGGKEESSIIGSKQKVPAPNAAQANATMAHALDFDDVHEAAVMHPGIASIPVVMAVGEAQGNLSGKELITSTALGVDMMCRLALATTPGKSPIELGWHLTSLFGFMGSAATAARVMGLDEETIVDAIGIGYHQCAGNGQCVKDGALTKEAWAGICHQGRHHCRIAGEGRRYRRKEFLRRRMGSLPAIHAWGLQSGNSYGGYWESDSKASMSQSNRIRAAAAFIRPLTPDWLWPSDENIRSGDIREIVLSVTDAHLSLLCQPLDAKRSPRSPVDAQFSIPWGVASAIVGRRVGLDDFTENAIKNREVLEVTQKMRVEVDNTLHRPGPEPTRVKVITKDGQDFCKGS